MDRNTSITLNDLSDQEKRSVHQLKTWKKFHHGPRAQSGPLLSCLGDYPTSVMIAGCQRSGTTMLTRVIAESQGYTALKITADDELDAALALCGVITLPKQNQYCFQTTYLNERYPEYRNIGPQQKLIWLVRHPDSVIRSMLYNWKNFALNELYQDCGLFPESADERVSNSKYPWPLGVRYAERACSAYAGKSRQILDIAEMIPAEQLLVLDYDDLLANPEQGLNLAFNFVGATLNPAVAASVKRQNSYAEKPFETSIARQISKTALPVYEQVRQLCTPVAERAA